MSIGDSTGCSATGGGGAEQPEMLIPRQKMRSIRRENREGKGGIALITLYSFTLLHPKSPNRGPILASFG